MDSVEWLEGEIGERGSFAFDAVNADWFDSIDTELGPVRAGTLDPVVSIAEIVLASGQSILIDEIIRNAANKDEAGERRWIEILFDQGDLIVSHFPNLFGPPAVRKADIKPVPEKAVAALEQLVSLDEIDSATQKNLEAALAIQPGLAVSVYDVGQGNCNAVLNAAYQPLLYYDFGGGVMWHAGTVPPGLIGLCVCNHPPVILSHWDWDHWANALRAVTHAASGDPLALPWIAPRQKIGAVHRAFIAKLSNLLLWPDQGLTKLDVGPISVHKCDSTRSNRNHSGLVMEFRPGWAKGNGVLFPGDCDYDFLPDQVRQKQNYDVICVPHHGGKSPSANVFAPVAAASYKRLCYSAGDPNNYRHPRQETINAHRAKKWTPRDERYTFTGRKSGKQKFGHILLDPVWMVRSRSIPSPCACEVPYYQYRHNHRHWFTYAI
ncbi:MAG: hypothetical protein KJ871_04470 [Alphaproteobacteria bacterium]|nr:hypothetical protein [Alphaproteobacteria bacterium]MBU2083938.1 hypothetical protein [Alphaproteobacteria bacterium]MBU2142290.1 hypothetical protein [Alphaproteobacteria bacterium]MBU2196488.1 hypothetical protein [Alphaproteobacteria bacterium]